MPGPDRPASPGQGLVRRLAPWFGVVGFGERLGIAGMLLVILGSLLSWGAPPLWALGPVAPSYLNLVATTLAVLALLQLVSSESRVGDVVMLGLTGLATFAALGLTALETASGGLGVTLGMGLTAGGAAIGLVAMDVVRREAGLDYARMGFRALELIQQPRVQLALLKLLVPFALAGMFVFAMLELFGHHVAAKLGVVFVAYFFNPLGKEVAIPLALSGALPPALDPALAFSFVVLIDLCTALFFVWNYDHVLKVPLIGPFFAYVERKGNAAVVKYKWIRRLAFFGLVVYATLPLEGTGAIGGSVVGRVIGLNAFRTFVAVVLGSIIRTSLTTLIVLGAIAGLGLH